MKTAVMTGHRLVSGQDAASLGVRELGGKGLNLTRLAESGFAVPSFWIVPAGVFDEVLSQSKTQALGLVSRIDWLNTQESDWGARQLRALLLDPNNAALLRHGIGEELLSLMNPGALYAVRSSVVGEDSATDSHAGQMDTLLNVPASGVLAAILKVWASAFSGRALAYRQKKRLSLGEVHSAVIVQAMIQSAVSGVLFTADPQSGKRVCVISAGYGLGEGVVADRVETDTYRVAWHGDEITREISCKTSRLVLDSADGGGTRMESVPSERAAMPALSDAQLLQLRELGKNAERDFGPPQDIEWAFDERGRLYVLQARPIVGAACRDSGTLRIWDNSNIVESYPGLTLPLTFSFARSCYEMTFRRFAWRRALGYAPFGNPIRTRLPLFKNMIGLLEGRVYYNLLNWYEMMTFLPGFGRFKDSWDRMIGISARLDIPAPRLTPLNSLCAWVLCLWKLPTVQRNAQSFAIHFDTVYSRFHGLDLASATADQLIAIYQSLEYELADKWSLTLDNDFAAMAYYDWLRRLCARGKLAAHPHLHHDLLCGGRGLESIAPVHSLARIAAQCRAEPHYLALLAEVSDRRVWDAIQTTPDCAVLRQALQSHLDKYGDRAVEELKLECPSFREEPERLIATLRPLLRTPSVVEAREAYEGEVRENAERYWREHIRNPLERVMFGFVLRQTRLAVSQRESMRFARSRLFGLVRRLFLRMGELFAAEGVIGCRDDIHYLTVEEVFSFVEGASVTRNLRGLVELRKADYAGFACHVPGERIETSGIPCLDELGGRLAEAGAVNKAKGTGCSSGIVHGPARVVLDPRRPLEQDGFILIARSTDPGWVFLMMRARGVVVEKGSVLSHTAIIGRELGIPTVVGVPHATTSIPDGARVSLDGSTGEVRWHSGNLPSTLS